MFKLNFIIDNNHVFAHAISMAQQNEPFEGWADFTNKIWKEDPAVFYYLAGAPEYHLYLTESSVEEIIERADNRLKLVSQSEEYNKLIEETIKYRDFVETQWLKNEPIVRAYFSDVLGLETPDGEIEVFLTHPKLRNGMTAFFLEENHS